MKQPLVGPLAAIAAGILVSRYVPFQHSELFLAIAGFLLLGILALSQNCRWLAVTCSSLGFLFAGTLADVVRAPAPPPQLDATAREIVILEGCVVEPPAVSGDRARFLLELEPRARAQVTLYGKPTEPLPPLRYGQRMEMEARVRPPHNFGNPGAFDYARYLARRDIYWTASGPARALRVLPGRCGSWFQKVIMDLRAAALDRLALLYHGDPYETGMMQAILIGQSFQLQRIWTEEYRSTGTFHALVISGTHVAVLAAFFLFLLRICLVPEPAALLLTVLAAWLYALITGWQAPCVRSAAGLTLFMIAGYFYRERRIMNLLAAIALGFLVFDPEQLFDASFQLTFLAVGFLGAFAVPLIQATSGPRARALADLADTGRDLHLPPAIAQFRLEMRLLAGTLARLTRIPDRVANLAITLPARALFWIYDIVVTSAVVQMGLALPMVVYFHRVGFSGLSANAFVIPIMGLVVPLGFVAICTGWGWVAAAAGKLLALSQAIVAWHAALEPAWRIPAPPLWLAATISTALIATALLRGRPRIAAAAAAGALLAILVWHPFPPQHHPGELELTDIDVGQGESLLVGLPDGKHMLVDGGGIPAFGQRSRTQLDIGEDVVAPYLWTRSIRTLDIIAVSHTHDDHLGGIPALIDDFHPKELWTGATPDSPLWRQVRERAARNKTAIVPLQAGRHLQFGGAEIDVLAPPAAYVPADVPKNNDSLVLRIRYGRHAFLLTGDIERGIERAILPGMAAADVLKVAHHGSKTSSSDAFLDAVKPSFALISAGLDNIYEYPAAEILRRLQTRHAFVLRTDRDGLISISSDGRRLHVETGRWRAMEPKLLGLF